MPTKKRPGGSKPKQPVPAAGASVDDMLLAALERGSTNYETGRYLVTAKEGAAEHGLKSLSAMGMRIADARDFSDEAATLESAGDADGMHYAEIGVTLVSASAAAERSFGAQMESVAGDAVESVDPEYFVFALGDTSEFLRGFLRATETIAKEIGGMPKELADAEEEALVLGATWGLNACRVPSSPRSGSGIKVAVLDTGMDLGHPDFAGCSIIS